MDDHSVFNDQPARCPQCGEAGPIPIIYVAPSQEMKIAARLGEIVIGEDTPDDPAPLWACQKSECGLRF